MIDLHTHILPNIDDGAFNVETALQMTEALYSQGVSMAVCTPHFDPSSTAVEDFVRKRSFALSKMWGSRIRLLPASETLFHEYLFHLMDLSELCINNTRYLLLELPYQKKYETIVFDHIKRLMDYYNIIPVIAHIERYPGIKERHMKTLLNMGCLLQLNGEAVLNEKTRSKALHYLKKEYIGVIGSDCHDLQKRPPDLSRAFDLIRKKLGAACCERLDYNGECIVNGIELRKKKSYIIE